MANLLESDHVPRLIGALVGAVVGLAVGLVITVVVIAAKIGFFVDAPRAAHPLILIAFFAVPAAAGAAGVPAG